MIILTVLCDNKRNCNCWENNKINKNLVKRN